jgi:hypothetical protein
VLDLTAQQLVVTCVAESTWHLRVDHLDLLDYCVLELPDFRRSYWIQSRHVGVVVEDCLLLEVLDFGSDFSDCVLRKFYGLHELLQVGLVQLTRGIVDLLQSVGLAVEYFIQLLDHAVHDLHLLVLAQHRGR